MAATSTPTWTTPRDVIARLRKRWERGEFLSQLAAGTDFAPLAIPLRGPTAGDITQHYDDVLAWATSWTPDKHRHLRIEYRKLGGRLAGVNNAPARAWIDHRDDLFQLLGVTNTATRYTSLLAAARKNLPPLAAWMAEHPMKVVQREVDWPRLQATVQWITDYRGPAVYLRQHLDLAHCYRRVPKLAGPARGELLLQAGGVAAGLI